jgi:predicted O-methyltransferase YrrM
MDEVKVKAIQFVSNLLERKQVQDEGGNFYPLHSEIKPKEGEFLMKVIADNKCTKGIEVGCAYGISSLYICAALSQFGQVSHTIIDPFQREWKNIGILNLKRAGLDFFSLVEELSETALPSLLKGNKKFDFAFIDGWHTFDHVLIDFFYINRMLEVGGVIVFHDVDMPSIKKLLRYILNYPSYEFVGSVEGIEYPVSMKRKIYERFGLGSLRGLSKFVPKKYTYDIFSDKIISSDHSLGLNATMLAIRKKSNDERDWRWYAEF